MDNIEFKISDFLKVVADPTRRLIFSLLVVEELNPQEIADKISITRPAVEKHLKILLEYDLIQKSVKGYPKPRYVYGTTFIGENIFEDISKVIVNYFASRLGIINAQIEDLEKRYIRGLISKKEYSDKKNPLLAKQKELTDINLTKAYVDEAKKVIKTYEKDKKAF